MYTANNQVIFEEIYDETIQPTEEEIIEYANFLGIDQKEESELMWIARQGVMAPLPRGWKPVQDPQGELYYFNFETGESIWDHPCDQDFKKLVIEERKLLKEKGKENYLANLSESRQASPTKIRNVLRNSDKINGISSLKSTSTISDVLNGKLNENKNLRSGFSMFDTKELGNVEYEEENDQPFKDDEDEKDEDEEESEPSWKKKSDSEESSDGFHKPVDFGIDKDTSMKLDKLNVMLMVGKEKELNASNQNRMSLDSNRMSLDATTSRDGLDSPTRAYVRKTTGYRDEDSEVKMSKSFLGDSIEKRESKNVEDINKSTRLEPDHQKDLKLLQDSLEREFDQKRLELLENKDLKLKKLKEEIEQDLNRYTETERKRITKQQEDKLKILKESMQHELEKEQDALKKKHSEQISQMQKEFDNEKHLRKEKFSMQISKYMKSGKSFDELDENEEKRELAIYFDHIEQKYSEKIEDRKKELQIRYEKRMKETEDKLETLYEEEAEKKNNEIRFLKEKNLRIESFDKQMKDLLDEKMKEFKKREQTEMEAIKHEYEIRIKAFRAKYKDLEEKEFKYLENEFNKVKENMHIDHKSRIKDLEENLKINYDKFKREEEDLKKRFDMVDERRKVFDKEWNDLDEKEKLIDEKKESIKDKLMNVENENDFIMKTKYELERLKLENNDLLIKLNATQKLMDKFYKSNSSKPMNASDIEKQTENDKNYDNNEEEKEEDDDDGDESSENEINLKEKLTRKELISSKNDYLDDDNDDNDMKELIRHAKQKLKLKYYDAKKNADYTNHKHNQNSTHLNNSNSSINSNSIVDNAKENLLVLSSSSNNNSSNSNSSDGNSENESETKTKKKTNEFITYRQINKQHQQLHQDFSSVNTDMHTDLSKHKLYLIDNLNKEKDALQLANELLIKYKQTLAKRRLMLDSARQEMNTDEKYQSKSQNAFDKTKLESKKVMLDKEEIDIKQLLLNIKTSKRLLKQKGAQLKLLEKNVFTNNVNSSFFKESFSSDTSDLSQNGEPHLNQNFKPDNKSIATLTSSLTSNVNLEKISDDSNLNELIYKLKLLHTNGDLTETSIRSLQPILLTLPKLNLKLKEAFHNMSKYSSSSKSSYDINESTETASALNFINEKWQKYLNSSETNELNRSSLSGGLNSQLMFLNNKRHLIKTIENVVGGNSTDMGQLGGTWKNSQAYQKLTFESGTKLLDDKWNKYVGASSQILLPKKKNTSASTTTNKYLSSSLILASSNNTSNNIGLPVATQQRLNQHREWLKKFKQETDIKPTHFKF